MKKIIIAGILLLLAAAVTAGLLVEIKTVSVSGNQRYTAEELEAKIFTGKFAKNSTVQFIRNLLNKKEKIPFVEDYKIIFNSPSDVEIIVYEKSIIAYVSYMNNYMFFDKDGIVVESSSEGLEGIPEIKGLRFGNIVLYRKLPVANDRIFDNILNLTQALHTHEVPCSEVLYTESGNITLYIGDLTVELGNSSNITEKISELADIIPSIDDKKGTLYLDTYDENASNPVYSFRIQQ